MNRRELLQALGAIIPGTAALRRPPAWTTRPERLERIGVQLYKVRPAMVQDFEGTLPKVPAIR